LYGTLLIGTAGSGKSLLTKALSDILRSKDLDTITVNLDPGVLNLPYEPEVDVRNLLTVNEIMEKYSLGPNGAMIMASDLLAVKLDEINEEVAQLRPDYVLVDTPGQMELFAFRASGPYVARELDFESKLVLYLFDAVFSNDPTNFVSNLFLFTAVFHRFLLPQYSVLSKVDLLPEKEIEKMVLWSQDPSELELAVQSQLTGDIRLISKDLLNAIAGLEQNSTLFPVSATTYEGLLELDAAIQRQFRGGEEIF
jgi:GTPase SAR1 family protein